MDKDRFAEHLKRATGQARELASTCVTNLLPADCRYIVELNCSYDGNPLADGETVFPQDVSSDGKHIGPLIASDAIELLWRDGRVPEWIDISVNRVVENQTRFQLLCCGRFTDREDMLYYRQSNRAPFGVKSPILPPGWSKEQGRFDLHSRQVIKPKFSFIKWWNKLWRPRSN